MTTEERILYRPNEAAYALGIGRATLYELMARGDVGFVKIGTSRRIPHAELIRYVERLRSEAGLPPETSRQASNHTHD